MIYFQKKNLKGEVTITNFINISSKGPRKIKEYSSKSGDLVILALDKDSQKSNNFFKKIGEVCVSIFESIYAHFIELLKAQSHTLKTIQGQITQKIEGLTQDQQMISAKDYDEQKDVILQIVKEQPEKVADTILYLQKRIFEIGAHMASFEVLHMGEHIDFDFRLHNLRRLIINILHAFKNVFDDLGIHPHFFFDDQYAESNKIKADYKTLNAALYNFFDNATKYVKPYSEIRFFLSVEKDYISLCISMKSLRIDKDELQSIFNYSYRGRHCKNEEGSGIGMYVIKKALELNDIKIEVVPDYSDMEEYNEQQYILNKFFFQYNIHI